MEWRRLQPMMFVPAVREEVAGNRLPIKLGILAA